MCDLTVPLKNELECEISWRTGKGTLRQRETTERPQVYSVLVLDKNFVQQPIISFLCMFAQNNIQKRTILSQRLLMKRNRAKST